jgi:hypothetical protein
MLDPVSIPTIEYITLLVFSSIMIGIWIYIKGKE